MSIAIIIGTHGSAAEQLLKTAEMILGEQDNVAYIDFVPGENAETLIEKVHGKAGWFRHQQRRAFSGRYLGWQPV